MFPYLSDLINYILEALFGWSLPFRIPFATFGSFLALVFVVGAIITRIGLREKEDAGVLKPIQRTEIIGGPPNIVSLIFNGILGYVFGVFALNGIMNYSTCSVDPQSFIGSLEFGAPVSILGGLLGAAFFTVPRIIQNRRDRLENPKTLTKTEWPHENVVDIIMWAAIGGLLGGKIFTFFDGPGQFQNFLQDPFGFLFSLGGLTIYGGLIGGALSVLFYARKKNIPLIHLADVAAPALMLGYGVGRIGCQLSGDGDWGLENLQPKPEWMAFLPDWLWSFDYPNNVNRQCLPYADYRGEGYPCSWADLKRLVVPVWPTPIYETAMATIIFGILWFLRKRLVYPGAIMALYLIFNGIERFNIEKIRHNPEFPWAGNLSQAEIIAIFFVIGGVVLWLWARWRYKKDPSWHLPK